MTNLKAEIVESVNRGVPLSMELIGRILEALPGWISVEESLPEENRAVIVPGGMGILDHGNWYSIMDRGLRNPERIEWEVTHWQPLPAPPEVKR